MNELMIKLENVSKIYRLGSIGGGTLRGDLQSFLAKIRGKEDPNAKIGSEIKGKQGDRFYALKDVSFEVKKGEAIGIIGHNGAGKSTLLKLLSRVTAPTGGKISHNGRIASMLEVGTGFHPELTGSENVYMNGAILGMTKSEIDKKFDNIVKFAEMEQFIDTPVKRYSSGMYVKLAFSVAAHLDSEILIMDEVLAVGDAAFQEKCIEKMSSISHDEARTILYVSHNMNTIRKLCDRCIVLNRGSVIYEGDVESSIAIYFDKNFELKSFYDFNSLKRPNGQCAKVKINTFQFIDKVLPVYFEKEPLKFSITWTAYETIQNLSFRFVICSKTQEAIGMSQKNCFASAVAGKEYLDEFELDISVLPEGDYLFFIVFYNLISNGDNVVLDGPPIYIPFKRDIKSEVGLRWDHQSWGNIIFPEIDVKRIKEG